MFRIFLRWEDYHFFCWDTHPIHIYPKTDMKSNMKFYLLAIAAVLLLRPVQVSRILTSPLTSVGQAHLRESEDGKSRLIS